MLAKAKSELTYRLGILEQLNKDQVAHGDHGDLVPGRNCQEQEGHTFGRRTNLPAHLVSIRSELAAQVFGESH